MHICIVSEGYPYKNYSYPFVKQLCIALADKGMEITVIVPQSVTKILYRRLSVAPKKRVEYTDKGNKIEVYAPYIMTFGNFGKNISIVNKLRQKVIASLISSLKNKPDVIYGHFWHTAYDAYDIAKKMNIPLFVASGESEIRLHKRYDLKLLEPFTNYVSGVICVSTKNKEESIYAGLTKEDKCVVIPNSIDTTIFYVKDKQKLREKFGYSADDFIVAFVGWFIERKGPDRIAAAISSLNDKNIKSIFIGRSPNSDTAHIPKCPGILFMGSLPHDKIADYLNCADIFVMPTLHEGCCNANIEAMACGLPVISSDKDFNYDILDSSCSILIDPMNIKEIADSIYLLKNNPEKRLELSYNALKKVQFFRIEERAQKIITFIRLKTDKTNCA